MLLALERLCELDDSGAVTSYRIATATGIPRTTVFYHLKKMYFEGVVDRVGIGSRGNVEMVYKYKLAGRDER